MALNQQQVTDLWNAVTSGQSKVPFFIPRDFVMRQLDRGLAEVPPSLRSATVSEIVDQLASWRRFGSLR